MTPTDLTALWSAWLRDPTLHRACNLVGSIMRQAVEHAARKGAPDAEEGAERTDIARAADDGPPCIHSDAGADNP